MFRGGGLKQFGGGVRSLMRPPSVFYNQKIKIENVDLNQKILAQEYLPCERMPCMHAYARKKFDQKNKMGGGGTKAAKMP